MPQLKVTRYLQDYSHCAVAAAAAIGNYYNTDINYELTKEITYNLFKLKPKTFPGLTSGEIGLLLNALGIPSIDIISTDLDYLDYEWQGKSIKHICKKLNKLVKKKNFDNRMECKRLVDFLTNGSDNRLIIDFEYGKYIRESISKNSPVIIIYNWNIFFREPKEKDEYQMHAVVVNGCDALGVDIIDSHHMFEKDDKKFYQNGKYKVSWENLMAIMWGGAVIVPKK